MFDSKFVPCFKIPRNNYLPLAKVCNQPHQQQDSMNNIIQRFTKHYKAHPSTSKPFVPEAVDIESTEIQHRFNEQRNLQAAKDLN